ncbi:MAG TPA: prenyltransferase, partial [Bacillota bacterium]|nr:prenyltransferase [Bacillota bacterium]
GTYSHTSDIIAPAGGDFGAALTGGDAVSWPEFRQRRLAPLRQASGHLIWQFGENEELVRLYLDDSLERGGYAAISTFHFGNPDFTNSEPFLQRYRGRLPFVALQDAHGEEPWWFADMTTGFRTVFLGTEPTWAAWLQALECNWVVAIRHDAVSGFKTWMHGGAPEVLEFVRQHETDWCWWDNPQIQRPLVSLVAVTPADSFESGRPEQGVMLRVRCAWENTAQGLPKKAITELVKLTVDGAEVAPQLVAKKQPRGPAYLDYYHQFQVPNPAPGKHTATAVVRVVETGAELKRTVEFGA